MNKNILFFGELAPNIIHGISLANRLNIDLLRFFFEVDIVEEKNILKDHTKRSSSKLKKIISSVNEIFHLNKKNQYDYFYTVFSLSIFGSVKTLGSIFSFILSGKGKVFLHIHRGDFEVFYKKSFINRFLTKLIFNFTDKLIVLSKNQKQEFSMHFDNNNIFVLENSLSHEYEFKEIKKTTKFIYISNYIQEKGIFELLEVFSNNKDLYLECFGGFVNNEKEIILYKTTNININGFIDGKDKYKKICEAEALILPSWNEGQPTIILEAMMMGTIVLTTKVGLIGELLGDDYPFYFKFQNIESLEDCIKKFETYKSKGELSKKMKIIYKNKFSKQIHKEKLLKIFKGNEE